MPLRLSDTSASMPLSTLLLLAMSPVSTTSLRMVSSDRLPLSSMRLSDTWVVAPSTLVLVESPVLALAMPAPPAIMTPLTAVTAKDLVKMFCIMLPPYISIGNGGH